MLLAIDSLRKEKSNLNKQGKKGGRMGNGNQFVTFNYDTESIKS